MSVPQAARSGFSRGTASSVTRRRPLRSAGVLLRPVPSRSDFALLLHHLWITSRCLCIISASVLHRVSSCIPSSMPDGMQTLTIERFGIVAERHLTGPQRQAVGLG
jgi:hypothetical protein